MSAGAMEAAADWIARARDAGLSVAISQEGERTALACDFDPEDDVNAERLARGQALVRELINSDFGSVLFEVLEAEAWGNSLTKRN